MRLVLLSLIILFASCGAQVQGLNYGASNRSDVIALKGANPDREEPIAAKDGSVMVYKDEFFQLKGEVVTHHLREPLGEERQLLYWRHKFKDCEFKEMALEKDKSSHAPPERQLNCDGLGLAVTYVQGTDAVTKVIEYAKKR